MWSAPVSVSANPAANPQTNPDGLPVGLAKTVNTDGRWKGEYVGVTCAACHNNQLTYKGKRIRIDGAGMPAPTKA
jgi:hypothetical protein